jgi:hypothetical protein
MENPKARIVSDLPSPQGVTTMRESTKLLPPTDYFQYYSSLQNQVCSSRVTACDLRLIAMTPVLRIVLSNRPT